MSEAQHIEQAEYDGRWASSERGDTAYSAKDIGYTPNFLRFMDEGLNGLPKPIRALEVGCGDGFFTGQLAERGCDATGIDLSPVGIKIAAQRYPGARFLVHDLANPLPFPDASIDLVWCSEVLEHLFSPLSVLQEIQRILRPGGQARITVPYHGLLKNLGIALLAFERHYDPTYPHIRFFTKRSLSELVERAGLTIDSVAACGSNLGLRDWVVKTNILLAARRA